LKFGVGGKKLIIFSRVGLVKGFDQLRGENTTVWRAGR